MTTKEFFLSTWSKSRATAFAMASITLLAAGCGGSGGSGGGGSTPAPPSAPSQILYTGSTTQAQISQSNASSVYQEALGGGESQTTIASTSKGMAINGLMPEKMTPVVRQLVDEKLVAKFIKQTNTMSAQVAVNDQVNGSVSGTASLTGDLTPNPSDPSYGSGWLTFTYNNYDNGNGALTGTIQLAVNRVDLYINGRLFDYSASYSLVEFKDLKTNRHTKSSGSYTYLFDTTTFTSTYTYNEDFINLISGKSYRYKNFQLSYGYTTNYPTANSQVDYSISGRIYIQQHGFVDITTVVPIHYPFAQTKATTGKVIVFGTGGSELCMMIASQTRIAIVLDVNGDGTPELANMYTYGAELTGAPQPNSGPSITSATLSPISPRANDSITATTAGVSDPDGDNLITTYTWKANGAPIAGQNSVSLPSGQFKKGEIITLDVSVSDGLLTATTSASGVTVLNTDPIIGSVSITPINPTENSALTAQVTGVSDADNDPLTYNYVWKKNGSVVAGNNTTTLPGSQTAIADSFTVTATVSDGTASASMTSVAVSIPAQPVVVSANPPTAGIYGQPVNFQVTALQGDNLPISYSVHYGPAGMTVDANGNVNWTPTEPMLSDTLTVNYAIRAQARSVFGDFVESIVVSNPTHQAPILRHGITEPSAPIIVDMNGDGKNELLMTDNEQRIYFLKFNGVDYVEDWSFPFDISPGNTINRIITQDLNADGKPEILVAIDKNIYAIDTASNVATLMFSDPSNIYYDLKIVDLNQDGTLEMVCIMSTPNGGNISQMPRHIRVYDFSSKVILWESGTLVGPLQAGSIINNAWISMQIANVDNDTALEIVITSGDVFDGATFTKEWAFPGGFGASVAIGDLDNNGIGEIASIFYPTGVPVIRTYSAITKQLISEHAPAPVFSSVLGSNIYAKLYSLITVNADADPNEEIAVVYNQIGTKVQVYDGPAIAAKHSWSDAGFGISGSLAVGDANTDGKVDLIMSSNAMHISTLQPTMVTEWTSSGIELTAPFFGGYLANTDPNNQEIVFSTPYTDYFQRGHRLLRIDPLTFNLSVSGTLFNDSSNSSVIDIFDYDSDGTDEIFFSLAASPGEPTALGLSAYDLLTNSVDWSLAAVELSSLSHVDMNNDGIQELIGMRSGKVVIVDIATSSILWESTVLPGYLNQDIGYDITDINKDGFPEIIAASLSGITVFNNNSGTLIYAGFIPAYSPDHVYMDDIDGNGSEEIIVGNIESISVYGSSSSISIFNGDTLNLINTYSVPFLLSEMIIQNHGQPGKKNILAAGQELLHGGSVANSRNWLTLLDASSGSEIWTSPSIIGEVTNNSLRYTDINNDGTDNLIFGTDKAMYITR